MKTLLFSGNYLNATHEHLQISTYHTVQRYVKNKKTAPQISIFTTVLHQKAITRVKGHYTSSISLMSCLRRMIGVNLDMLYKTGNGERNECTL